MGVGAKATPPTGTITFLFTDIECSARRWDEAPEAMKAALSLDDAVALALAQTTGG